VFVFSADRAFWTDGSRRIKAVRANANGVYSITGLPPGDYRLCALTEFDAALQYDPPYLEQFFSASLPILLGENERKKQDLRIGGGN
jgi:hypothetical protein